MARADSQTPPRKAMGSRGRERTETKTVTQDEWLNRAAVAYDASTSFIENNYRKDWEDSIKNFQNKHPTGSKYHSEQYKHRSKNFRPKTRSMVRNNEAAAAGAFFSQLDVVSIEAEDEKNPINAASASVRQNLLNYRLSEHGQIPWFQICIGGLQDGQIFGVIASKQWWQYEYRDVEEPLTDPTGEQQVLDNETGRPAVQKRRIKIKDRPWITLYPIENIRFSPAADWVDVANSSPYLIALEPVYVGDVKKRIQAGEFNAVDEKTLLLARNAGYEPLRRAREDGKEDATDPRFDAPLTDFDVVWVHENFMRIDGQEIHFYTLGTQARLTDPKPLEEVYFHCENGERPIVIGTCAVEAHRAIPDAPVHLVKGLQREANDIANTRRDNVLLVLQKRFLVRRGKQVDLKSLHQNAPGSPTLVTDIERDVLPMDFNDVTQSAYAEQDRVNVDMDELAGNFSQSSVASNRKLNETVGGMAMLRGSANSLTQYMIRVFAETWVERVLRQVDRLEQYYESDVQLLGLMARKSGFSEKYGIDTEQLPPGFWERLLMQPASVKVNVANSAMDPLLRLDQFLMALTKYGEMAQTLPPDIDRGAVKDTIFALLGFKDARRFTVDEGNLPPEVVQMKAQYEQALKEAQQEIAKLQSGHELKLLQAHANIQLSKEEAAGRLAVIREESEARLALQREKHLGELALKERDGDVKLHLGRLSEETKLLIAQMQQQSKDNAAVLSDDTKRFAAQLQQQSQRMLAAMLGKPIEDENSETEDMTAAQLQAMTEAFKRVAEGLISSSESSQRIVEQLSNNTEVLSSLVRTLNAPRETRVTQTDARGMPIASVSQIAG